MIYRVVEAATADQLARDLEPLLKGGWRLQGGVAVAVWTETRRELGHEYQEPCHQWAQALVWGESNEHEQRKTD